MPRAKEEKQIPFGDDRKKSHSVQRFVGIDWSGRIDAAGQRRHIWSGTWTRRDSGKVTVRLEAGRTREEIAEWLHSSCEGRDHDRRFWGKPHKRPAEFCGEGLRTMYRHTDYDNKIAQALAGGDPERAAKMKGITPKSPFQIGGSGSVGTGSLRAIPMLVRLHDEGFRVWPVEDAVFGESPRPLLVEMYTRLMTGAVAKSNAEARKRYLAQRRKEDPVFAPVGRAVMTKAEGSEDAFDALVSVLEMVRHAEAFPRLRATEDAQLKMEGNTWRPGVG